MIRKRSRRCVMTPLFISGALLALLACDDHGETTQPGVVQTSGVTKPQRGKSAKTTAAKARTNRLRVPASVRTNLGVVFQRAELRAVRRTLRLPGRFELKRTATRTSHAPLAGGVELAVQELERVKKGQLLATIRAPKLRERQHALHKAEHGIRRAKAELALLSAQMDAAKRNLRFAKGRVSRLGGASVRRASLEGVLLKAQSAVRVLSIRVRSARDEVRRERHHREVQLRELADVTGLSARVLAEPAKPDRGRKRRRDALHQSWHGAGGHGGQGHGRAPLWDQLSHIQLRATTAGVVTRIAVQPGAWAARGAAVVDVSRERDLRFVATALQSDVARLKDGARATIAPPTLSRPVRRGEKPAAATVSAGKVQLGVALNSKAHTLPLVVLLHQIPAWARAGVTAHVDVIVAGSSAKEVAIPRAAVVRDGLHDVFFRRDPADPDQVIRVEAELGVDDGRWVVLYSGVNTGDEVVVEGAYELKLASGNRGNASGHFHADGSFHPAEKK